MPPIDVVLQQETGIDWSTIVVALASFVGVLVASLLTGRSTRKAADKSAQALLDVEEARRDIEHRRYMRGLIADVAATARRRSLLTFRSAVVDFHGQRDALWSDEDQAAHERTVSDFAHAAGLVRLTTTNLDIMTALERVVVVDLEMKALYEEHRERGALRNHALLKGITDISNRLDDAADGLVSTAADLLREPTHPIRR
jgi:hypothetical protein